jgi:hypothetical protein
LLGLLTSGICEMLTGPNKKGGAGSYPRAAPLSKT